VHAAPHTEVIILQYTNVHWQIEFIFRQNLFLGRQLQRTKVMLRWLHIHKESRQQYRKLKGIL